MPALPRCLTMLLVFWATCAAAQTPSLDDVRLDFGKGDYRSALQKANRLTSFSSQDLPAANKYELLMLRGECQVQLKDRLGAVTSFKSAAKCAGDVKQLALAKANALIIDRSSMGKYTPRYGVGKEPIDILPMESRKEAMAGLKTELWSQNQKQIEAALTATTLPPIEKGFAPLSDMFYLETAATGQATDTDKMMHDLGQHTYQLMLSELSRYSRRMDQLTEMANSSSDGVGNWGGVRRGLISPERNEVKDSATYLVKLRDRATEYRGIASKLGGNEQRWDALVADVNDTLASAEALFNDR